MNRLIPILTPLFFGWTISLRYLHACTSLPLADGQLSVMVAGRYCHVPVLLKILAHVYEPTAGGRSAGWGGSRWILSCTCVVSWYLQSCISPPMVECQPGVQVQVDTLMYLCYSRYLHACTSLQLAKGQPAGCDGGRWKISYTCVAL